MKRSLLVLLTTCFALVTFAQSPKQKDFEIAVKNIVTAFQKSDNKTIKNYIDPKLGVYLLYRSGVFDQFTHFDKLNLKDSSYPGVMIRGKVPFSGLQYQQMPKYNCDKSKWSSYGCFSDSVKAYHDLSTVCKNLNKFLLTENNEKISKKEIQKYEQWENQSRKVICCKKQGDVDLIFYLIYKNNKWIIWLIDKVTTDCSV